MNMNYEQNLSDALLKLQESLNEIVTNTYLLGVNDGYKLGLKGTWEDGNKPSDNIITKPISELGSQTSSVLSEAEKILREYS
ncbi:MAG: hypothetical protein JSU58_08575 [Dehalococcoidales bacterium]|nr:MAG: hypothetical protein JSU58_08575 [Dehalococcoidales bacterium]